MLAMSPPLFSTTYGWPIEDHLIANNPPYDCNETNSYNSLDFHVHDQLKQHISVPEHSTSGTDGGARDHVMVEKKLNHNACERDRRKRINDMYAFLRSLLPVSSELKKKTSIPRTISHVLNYIPELQKEVEMLKRKREKLLSYSTSINNTRQEHLGNKKRRANVSVSILHDKEVLIQLISATDLMSKNKEINLLSKVLEDLEQEEDGLVLKYATGFKSLGEGKLLSTLHLQVQGDHKIEFENLKEKLGAFDQ